MKREFLTSELGLPKEVTDKIMAQYGESVNGLREKVQAVQNEKKQLAAELSDLKECSKNNAELREKVQTLENEKTQLLKDFETAKATLADTKISNEIAMTLSAAGAKNVKAVSALLDKSTISVDEEGVHGLAEQIDAIKRDSGYLFYDGFMSSGMRHGPQVTAEDGFTHFARTGAKLK